MNERIRELSYEAQRYALNNTTDPDLAGLNELWQEKFAELIVEEMYVYMCDATDNDKPWPTFKEVKQHFGVEE